MLVLTVVLNVQPEHADQARIVLSKLVTASRQMAGVQAFNLGEDIQVPGVFHISEVYDDYEVKDNVESSEAFNQVIASIGGFFLSPPKVDIYQASKAE